MPYSDGQLVPPGYHVETQIRKGLVIAGACVFGATYLLTVVVAAEAGKGAEILYVPVVGPFVAAGVLAKGGELGASLAPVFILDGVAQLAGVGMFIAGMVAQKQVLVRNDVSFQVLPTPLGKGGLGLTVIGQM